MSLEAFLPFQLDPTGVPAYHIVGNIGLTAFYLNFLKSVYAPGILDIIVRNLKHTPSETLILRQLDNVRTFSLRLPCSHRQKYYQRQAYMNSPAHCATVKAEFITAKPLTLGSEHDSYHYPWTRSVPRPPADEWVPEHHADIVSIAEEIVEKFSNSKSKSKLQRAKDGVPYAGSEGTMPKDWCWWSAWIFASEGWECVSDMCTVLAQQSPRRDLRHPLAYP